MKVHHAIAQTALGIAKYINSGQAKNIITAVGAGISTGIAFYVGYVALY